MGDCVLRHPWSRLSLLLCIDAILGYLPVLTQREKQGTPASHTHLPLYPASVKDVSGPTVFSTMAFPSSRQAAHSVAQK